MRSKDDDLLEGKDEFSGLKKLRRRRGMIWLPPPPSCVFIADAFSDSPYYYIYQKYVI